MPQHRHPNFIMASYDHFFEEYQDFVEKKLGTSKADIPYCIMGLSEEIIEFEVAKNDQKEMLLEAGDVIYYIMLLSILEPCIELNYDNVDRSLPVENLHIIVQKLNKIGSNYSYRNMLRDSSAKWKNYCRIWSTTLQLSLGFLSDNWHTSI